MAEIGVHLHDEVGALGNRLGHAGDVGGAEPALTGAMNDRHALAAIRRRAVFLHQFVGDVAGAVGRIVVDNQ